MKVLFDTSVLVAAIIQVHPVHDRALPWLQRAKAGKVEFLVASHTLAELYAVLSTLPVSPRIPAATAWRLVKDNVQRAARIIGLSASDYRATLTHVSELGLSGGIIYDALIMKAALKGEADRLLTLNADDFRRAWPGREDIVFVP